MNNEQISFYEENGYVIIEDFLDPEELDQWRQAVTQVVKGRNGLKIPGKDIWRGRGHSHLA